ncbi:filamentous hemagglutinin N-terminal domain-containing protein [Sphingomonas sp. R-74633]|uniref:YDG domain-containing protein n=1 Tax=Sphingomonas sp. R-74633 TaxID=2751188 RepID=UPI0015D3B921|nr:YDG domain-containing protein [Sphingomonas sp. R-74633]NYT39717.1 filamentous hemagglutinin N-terminal domain-containing protein [Sphingomonas sp. R-74633]
MTRCKKSHSLLLSTALSSLFGRHGAALGAFALLAGATPAYAQDALPTGGTFVQGQGQIGQPSPNQLEVRQGSTRGVIDWQSFSIADAYRVLIDNGDGATLNRVRGGDISRIDGLLSATGSVYLMNPNGVIVGPGGKVLAGGNFVASTRAIDADAFMAGGALAVRGSGDGAIVNGGSIVSKTGSVVMIARAVTNTGSIAAKAGHVTLAAADDVLLAATDGKSDGIYVAVGGGRGDITQAGRIEAAAVALRAANGNIFALAGNRDGLVQATGTATVNGELWLTAPQGTVEVSGTLKASNADGSGGRVTVNGRDVALGATADISAAGTRGGEVVIGAATYGSGTGLARTTRIADGARIIAGGTSGGGRIETSGKALDIGAAHIVAGTGGKWLIDPDDLLIDTAAATAIVTSLNGGTDVQQVTTAGGTGGVGDITVAAPIVWTGSGDLELNAYRDVLVNQTISGGGNVQITAARNIAVNAAISSTTQIDGVAAASFTIGAAGSLSSAGNVGIAGASFVNQGGAGSVSSSGGRWLILSDDAAGSSDGGLTPDFYQYDYAVAAAPGNGRAYRQAPSVSFTLGPVVKDYDGTTTALLDGSNVNATGLVNGDAFALDGSYATKNAGTGINVTATNFTANRGGIPVFGYNVTTPSVTAAVGTINRATLTAAIIGNPTKTYNATTAVSLTSANFGLIGIAAGESIIVNGAATEAYDSANAGSRTVDATFQTSNFTAGSGTVLTNYILPTTATGAGLINPASLIVSGVTANDKVYDGTTAATLDTGAASVFGIVGGDDVSLDLSGASGVFATRNVGNAIAVTGTGFALSGTDAANYVVGQPSGIAANITPAALVVSGLVANDKTYDGTTTGTLNTAGLQITALISGDDVTPDGSGAQINFATKNAGQDIPVSIAGVTLTGADAGNYEITYSGSLTADILQRVLTFGFAGVPTKVYDGTTNVVVSGANASLGNVVAGESVSIAQAANVEYASKNVGVWNIIGTLTPADFVAGAGTLLANYSLPTTVGSQGEITPAPLTISITNNPTKPYDGNAGASLGPGNFAVSGFVVGEGATVTETSGTYAASDAGVWTVSANLDASDFDPNANTMMSNYIIPSPVTGPGTITRIPLGPGVIVVDITGNPSKTYDGTTVATLTSSDYTLDGFIAGEGATITETVGTYDLKDAGLRAVLVLLDPSDFAPDPGTNLANYTLPTQATGIGTIFQRALTAAIIGNPTKIYNGTTRAIVVPGNYSITGLVAGESVTVAPGVVATYGSEDAGVRLITANFTADSNFVFASGTSRGNYILPVIAQGPGTITPAPLLVLGVSAQNKVYDQTTTAILAGSASLFGVVAGDTVTLDGGSASGTFATANVGNGIAVTVAGYGISGTDAGNYQLFQPTGLSANITRRGLVIANVSALDRAYDGTTVATLDLGSAGLNGVLGSDDVLLDSGGSSAVFLQKNVGTNLRVIASGFALTGAQAGNYSLSQPSGLTADITALALTGAILGNPTKTYDGTTSVSLTGANYSLTGFVAGEGGSITQSSGAAYDSANAGGRIVTATLVVSDFVANAGTLLSNYALPTSISGAGTITQAQLIAAIIGNPTRVYDSSTNATLTSANYQLAGFVAGEGATITETAGLYDTKNVGGRTVTATLDTGDFTGTGSTNLANYALPVSASGAGTITAAQVQVTGILANDKTYDGTTAATLDSSGGGLSGVFGGDTVSLVSGGASGVFATKNVGTNITVTATGYAISGADAANYTVLQPIGLAADITQATIQLASVTRVYDATTAVPSADSAYTLAGVFAGDAVGVNASGITGNYADKNVGTGKSVTLSGVLLNGADAGNYLIAGSVTNALIGIITPATLNVLGAVALDKTYDQNTVAQLDNSGTTLSGVLLSDVVNLAFATTGNFDNANAGTNKPVTTTAYSISGTDAANYTLVQPQGLTATINPLEIFLASVTKVYDGNTSLPSASTGYAFTGVLSGDTVVAQTSGATGQYDDSKNVGTAKPVTVNGLTLTGAQGGNYFISSSITGNLGTITPAPLTVTITGDPTKTYDGNNLASLVSGDYTITGLVAGEILTINQTAGVYDTPNAGTRVVTVNLTPSNYTEVFDSRDNYILPTSASGAGTIDPRLLTITGVTADNKVYDGNAVASLNSSGAALQNVVSGDTVALNSAGATGVFASPNVGTGIAVTASGYALTNNPFGNYTLQQPTGLSADITQALLTISRVSRVYNGLLTLPTDSAGWTLAGAVSGDDVFVDTGAVLGAYASKNVGTGIAVTASGIVLGGSDSANYSLAPTLVAAPIGEITPATLTAAIIGTPTRIYDGTTAATLNAGNFQFSGFVLSEGATVTQTAGTYNSPDVVSATSVTAALTGFITADLGTDLSNYILPASATGAGAITPQALTAAILGDPTKTYDGTAAALLAAANYGLTGLVSGQSITVTQTAGLYASPNAGARLVTATLGSGDFTAGGGTLLSNYVLPTSAAGLGTIDPRVLTAAIIGNPTKIYDGNTIAALISGNFALTGFLSGEGATVTETVGAYDDADAGSRTVTATLDAGDFSATGATLLANYVLPVSASGAGTIGQKALSALIIGDPTRPYDGTNIASLLAANYLLTGFVGSDSATVTQTAGTYASVNAGTWLVTALLAGGDFTAGSGTTLANYALPTSATGLGTITRLALGVTVTGNPTRIYDGTTAATLTSGDYTLTGFLSGEGANVTETVGVYDSRNAGARTVNVTLDAGDFAALSGTLLANYVLPSSATGAGTINQRALTAAITGLPTRIYDATDAAILASSNYALTGFVAGEGATVTETAGIYASPNAGIRAVSTTLDAGDFQANAGTLLANYILPTSATGAGIIQRATLSAVIIGNPTRTYDATTAAALTSANYQLLGFIGGQGATVTETVGQYASPNAGIHTVTATLGSPDFTADAGTLLTNYVLPATASGLGTIDPKELTVLIVGTPTRVYDGTTAAVLSAGDFQLVGFVGGEGVGLTGTVDGSYGAKDVGLRTVTIDPASANLTANPGTLLSNYALRAGPNGIGQITPAPLTAALVDVFKTYDGTTAALLNSANFTLGGFVAGEGANVTETAGSYASPNTGSHLVTSALDASDFTANSGTDLNNYMLPASATGIGIIGQATLTAVIIGNPSRTYDGTVAALLNAGNYLLTGFISGESATVTETAGVYGEANAGTRAVTATLGADDFAAGSGTLLSNYILPTGAAGLGTIDPRALSVAIIGNPSRIYDGTTVASLISSNFALTGFVSGEGASVTETMGAYDDPNAGSRNVTATLDAGDFSASGATLLSNYVLPTDATGAGTIDQRALTAAIIGDPTRAYDGTDLATLAAFNFQLTGFVGAESAAVTQTAGRYDSPNAGSRIVTALLAGADFTAGAGTSLSNYILPTSATGTGTIDRLALGVAITGNPTRTYDGTTTATLTSADYTLTGFIAGEGASITETAGSYDSKDAGPRTVSVTLDGGDFAVIGGTLLSNYILPTSTTGAGTITQAMLSAAIIGNPTRAYDATTGATLSSANFALTGFVAGEGATVTETAGIYASADAGLRIVSATLDGSDFQANSGTMLSNYVLPTGAAGLGTITQAMLTAAIIGNPTRNYDGTTAATLTGANYQLTGFIAGQGASVTQSAGAYDSPNAGSRIVTALLAGGDFAANAGTSLSNYVLPVSATGAGTIDPLAIGVAITGNPTRSYDGTTAATLTSGDYTLTGFIVGEGASITETAGAYDGKDAGAHIVTVTLDGGDFAVIGGTLLSNYILPTSATGAGAITQAMLSAAIIGNPTRVYDATTAATLGSANFALTGFVAGEGAFVTRTSGTYDDPNAGARIVSTTLASGDFTASGGTLLSNYILPTSATGAGTITPAMLAAAIIGNPTRIYDGTTAAALTGANYQLTGFIGGQGASVTQTVGIYDSRNAGVRTIIAALGQGDFTADAGTSLSNYLLPSSASGAGTIDPRALTAAIVGNPTRPYDGTVAATLNPGNFALNGFVAGEGASVTQTSGTYSDRNAGSRTVTATLAAGNFAVTGATLLANYVLPTSATGAGQIDRAPITVTITGYPTKTYDGTTDATLTSGDYALAGFVTGEGATITETHGAYATQYVGVQQVSAALEAGDFSASSGTLLSNYILPTSAVGQGEILIDPVNPRCVIDLRGGCLPDAPVIFIRYGKTVGNPHFYIPYPVIDPIYLGRTNGFGGLPSIIAARTATPTDSSVIVQSGAPTVNSTEQILQQGGRDKQWRVVSTLPTAVDFPAEAP